MSENTYTCELPRDVVSLSIPRPGAHRRDWILLACRDKDYDIVRVQIADDGEIKRLSGDSNEPYSTLFERLGDHAAARKSTWCLAFRSRYALQQAGWIGALQRGDIQLERQLKLAGKQAGAGRVCLSHGLTELDLRLGRRKVKLLDWSNYGVSADDYDLSSEEITSERCLQIFADWIKAYSEIGLTASRASAAQVGWDAARRSLAKGPIFTSLDPEIRALERRCYYGGRCEPFRLGEIHGSCYLVDIRACYAAICSALAVPTQPLRYWRDGCDVNDVKSLPCGVWAADVVLSTDTPDYPVRVHGKTIYPTGRFATSLCGHELTAAIQAWHVERITRAVSYVGIEALGDYARWYVSARDRLASVNLHRQTPGLKAAFNSSLGFFARQGREWSEWEPAGSPPWWFGVTQDPDDAGAIVSAHTLDGQHELLRVGSEPRNASPIVHGAICSAARNALATIIGLVGREHVHYCDTDGLIVDAEGWRRLQACENVVGPHVGQLGVRHKAHASKINGQKNYQIGEHVVCAGLKQADHSKWSLGKDMRTGTGIVNRQGIVRPFALECEDVGDESPRFVNTVCGQ